MIADCIATRGNGTRLVWDCQQTAWSSLVYWPEIAPPAIYKATLDNHTDKSFPAALCRSQTWHDLPLLAMLFFAGAGSSALLDPLPVPASAAMGVDGSTCLVQLCSLSISTQWILESVKQQSISCQQPEQVIQPNCQRHVKACHR